MTIIAAILIFFITVIFHEFGHFFMAKLCNVKVLEFAIGMGPKIIKKQKGETLYSFRALPLGGFCQMEGEGEEAISERSFSRQKPLKKVLILAMGPIMNFLLAIILFAVVNLNTGVATTQIDKVVENSPAYRAGIKSGDIITNVNGVKIKEWQDFSNYIARIDVDDIQELKISLVNAEKEIEEIMLIPEYDEQQKRVLIGVQSAIVKSVSKSFKLAILQTINIIVLMFSFIGQLFTGKVGTENVGGPVAVVQMIGQAANYGIIALMQFSAFISINLGVFNLLPIPALDGSRILFALIELVRKKPISPDKEGFVHMIGFALLLILMVFITFNDVSRILVK